MSEDVAEQVADEVARCVHCGAIQGGSSAALDALYREVARLSQLAQDAGAREADLRREIRLLQETVARLRAGIVMLRGIVMLQGLDILFS
jgi:predicted  nucleic acid-binding Zn-ribbon protein